jgi:branched-subunit amino acid aminotransferase/4-amino-4-deoxychorismate lyase
VSTLGIVLGGRLVAGDTARVSVLDRGFLYGDGVSETTRARNGLPFAFTQHMERLQHSCRALGLTMPSPQSLRADAELALSALDVGEEDAAVRFQVTRGSSGVGLDDLESEAEPTVLVTARSIPPLDPRVVVRVARVDMPFSAPFGAKVLSYATTIHARAEARRRGRDDVLYVAPDGSVIEGGSSNVVAIVSGVVRAPSKGALLGITRGLVVEISRRLGVDVDEGALPWDELLGAEEAFLCSSLRGLARITAVDDVALPALGTLGDALRDAYVARFLLETTPSPPHS